MTYFRNALLEFDPVKSATNLTKHGVSLTEPSWDAALAWSDWDQRTPLIG